MAKRSGKFYRNNEKDVMKALGFKPTYNSGSGWIEKEDGETDYLLCQLKSTDAQSIKVNQKDLRILESNSVTSHKVPVFAIQFLNTNEVWLVVRPSEITEIANYLETGEKETKENFIDLDLSNHKELNTEVSRVIKSSESSRLEFHEERKKKFSRERKAW